MRQWESLAARAPKLAFGGAGGGDRAALASRERFSRYLRSLMEADAGAAEAQRAQLRQEMRYVVQGGGQQRHAHQHAFGGAGGSGGSGGGGGAGGGFGLNFSFGSQGIDMEGALQSFGLQPGQSHTPQRIGRDQHPLMDLQFGAAPAFEQEEAGPGIEGERVVGVAATKYFSVALTEAGEVRRRAPGWLAGAARGAVGSSCSGSGRG